MIFFVADSSSDVSEEFKEIYLLIKIGFPVKEFVIVNFAVYFFKSSVSIWNCVELSVLFDESNHI